jgi:acetyl-CoA carboxylase carboxyltransferase component
VRAQAIAATNRLPLVYLVDSSGIFLPMQDEVFPDDDDFGRIFRNNAVLSAQGIPQYAAIMGNCVAGGAYLPVLRDTVLMCRPIRIAMPWSSLRSGCGGPGPSSAGGSPGPCSRWESSGASTWESGR